MKFTKIIYLLFLLIFCKVSILLAQKKTIDSNAYARWSSLGQADISSDGKYVTYSIENEPIGSQSLIIQSTESNWKKSFIGARGQRLLTGKGGNYAVCLNQRDSLLIVSLGKDLIQYIPDVSSFNTCQNEESEWIVYQLKQGRKELIIQNLNTRKRKLYANVINKVMGENGLFIILQTEQKVDGKTVQGLRWIDISTGKNTLLWEGVKAENIVLDAKHQQVAFTCEKGLFFYNMTVHKLNCLINNQTTRLDSGLKLTGITRFSHDGNRLFINLKEEERQKPKTGLVEVWSYLDHKLQTQQEFEIEARTYATVVNLIDGKIIRLEREFEHLIFSPFERSPDTIGIIYHDGKRRDGFRSINDKGTCDLVSLKNGKRVQLKYSPLGVSPNGKYVVYHDLEQGCYISYNTKTGVYHNISKDFPAVLLEPALERNGIAGWFENDVLFYDAYDLWKMDLSGQKIPVNLTSGYGRTHNFIFSVVYGQYDSYPLREDQKIILSAFNVKTKKNGFYRIDIGNVKKPHLLSIGDYIYCTRMPRVDEDYLPIKAKNAEVYVVRRMSANEAPNYFSTKNFQSFKRLTNFNLQKEYNWYRTELHSWTSLDGNTLQGILYKPENFDPAKKYPVIFNYYERKSDRLNAYINPEVLCSGCVIDIPTYVSNGYLVFTPDIVYKIGDPMQGTYNSVVSAAKYIGALPYVNSAKMGIQGCSWGGIQTNYLVTHTNLFAAACSASGIADWVSDYGRLIPDGKTLQGMFEVGQFRMGKSIWEIPDAYIKNSPIFQLDKVTTPFLIMHTKMDGICPYEDAVELFNGLRRLGKKSWMLVYPNANHGVFGKDGEDYSIRMMQFFNHYLMDKQAPVWMTREIPAAKRGLGNDLEYDTKIKTLGPGLLTDDERRTADSLLTRKPIRITLR